MKNKVLVGFSANTELVLTYDRITLQEKGTLKQRPIPDLCGTSANVARAIQSLGGLSKVLVLTGTGDDYESNSLRFSLKNFLVPYSEFRVLNHSHFSILPIDGLPNVKIFGEKGTLEKDKIEGAIKKIEKEKGLWRVATGVRPEEVQMVKALFNKHAGHRTLNPRPELIADRLKFFEILESTDLLIMNHSEFDSCRVMSLGELHRYGPCLIIITQNENGGMFSMAGSSPERFDPCMEYCDISTETFGPGAGDWFHAAFITRCIEIGKSINTLTIEEIRECILFATRVSGKKVTMKGAANGPTQKDL